MGIYIAHGEYENEGRKVFYCGLGVKAPTKERAIRRIELTLGGKVHGIKPASAWPVDDGFELSPKMREASSILRGYDAWNRPGMGTFHLDI